jgi:hypothetical protein
MANVEDPPVANNVPQYYTRWVVVADPHAQSARTLLRMQLALMRRQGWTKIRRAKRGRQWLALAPGRRSSVAIATAEDAFFEYAHSRYPIPDADHVVNGKGIAGSLRSSIDSERPALAVELRPYPPPNNR